MSVRKYLLIPQLSLYALRAPRDQRQAWERYWSQIRSTGADGEVFWDAASGAEEDAAAGHLRRHADLGLPLVDLGCGNGRQTRAFTELAPRVLGLDRSASAIRRAHLETEEDLASVSAHRTAPEFRVGDATDPGLGGSVHGELGDVNVHLRGVLHVVEPGRRPDVVRTIEAMLGQRGTAYLIETDVSGDSLHYLVEQGATPTSMPDALRRLIAAGLRPPSHFGQEQVAEHFPSDRFQVLAEGPTTMYGVPLHPGGPVNPIPSYFAVIRPRP